MDPRTSLVIIKVVHTLAWAFLAGSVVGIPICAVAGRAAAWVHLNGGRAGRDWRASLQSPALPTH